MAYVSQERKRALALKIKAVLKKYGMKGTISVDNHSTLIVTIKEGAIDFIPAWNAAGRAEWEYKHPGWVWHDENYISVNEYWIEQQFAHNPEGCKFLLELKEAMNVGNHDRSDAQTDYFDVGWYTNVNIGKWNKPYKFVA